MGFKYYYAVPLFNHLNKGLPLLVLCLNLRFEFNLFAHAKIYPIAHGVAIVYLKTALVRRGFVMFLDLINDNSVYLSQKKMK